MPNQSYDYIVLGAGISGLSTAYYLQKQGARVLVLEKTAHPGGVMQSKTIGDFHIELGPNTVQMKNEHLEALITDLGLQSKIQLPSDHAKNRNILKNGKVVALPASPPALLFGKGVLTLKDKARILKELFIGKHAIDAKPSVDAFFRKRFGATIADYFVNPFISGIYAGRSEELSLRHCFPQIWKLEQHYGSVIKGMKKEAGKPKPIFRIEGGLGTLSTKMTERLNCRFQSSIKRIAKNEGLYHIETDEDIYQAKQVISTIPLHAFASVDTSSLIGDVDLNANYAPIRIYHIAVDTHLDQWNYPGFGILIPEKEKQLFLGALFNSSVFPDISPKNKTLISVFVGGARQKELLDLETEKFQKDLEANLRMVLGIQDKMEFIQTTNYKNAIPQYLLETQENLEEQLAKIEGENSGFHFLGNFKNGIAVGDCVKNAKELATLLSNSSYSD